jgi:methylisocitrate lyase
VTAEQARRAREAFRAGLASGHLQRYVGAFTPLSARLIEAAGFEGVYVSGSVLAAERCLPDIGLTTATEVADRGGQIAAATPLPTLIDADTGFGEPANVARTIASLEQAGLAGCHLEDQVNPKRCGHLDGKAVVETVEMVRKIRAAVAARTDPSFVLCARTDARAMEGFDAAVARARAYVDAGADMIFPEALRDLAEFEAFAAAVGVPILANMTEFGQSELFTTRQLADAGVAMVIYPVTLQRLAMGAIEDGLLQLATDGTQAALVGRMQTRARLYEVLRYAEYSQFDTSIFDFAVPGEHAVRSLR